MVCGVGVVCMVYEWCVCDGGGGCIRPHQSYGVL